MSEELEPLEIAEPPEDDLRQVLHIVRRLEKKQSVLNADFNGLFQSVLQLQRDVNFFTRRCEERGNMIRDFVSQVQENGLVEKETVLDFFRQLECAGTPVRPPSGEHPRARVAHDQFEFESDEPTDPGKPIK